MVESLDTNKKLSLDDNEEFKQLSTSAFGLIKEKQAQHARAKELNSIARLKRNEKMHRFRKLRKLDEFHHNRYLYEDYSPSPFGLVDMSENNSRMGALVPGAPAASPPYLSSSMNSLSLESAMAAIPNNSGQPVTRLDELLSLANPLIVLDAQLLENSFNQLKEIIGEANTSTDEQLVKLLIRNDCDLNRVVPIALNFE
jgi:hypothetical protein